MTLGPQLFERRGIGGHLIVILHYDLFLLYHRHILLNWLLKSKSIFLTLDNLHRNDLLVSFFQIQALLRFDRFRCILLLVDILQNFRAVRYTRLQIRWRLRVLLRIDQELILPQTTMYFDLAFWVDAWSAGVSDDVFDQLHGSATGALLRWTRRLLRYFQRLVFTGLHLTVINYFPFGHLLYLELMEVLVTGLFCLRKGNMGHIVLLSVLLVLPRDLRSLHPDFLSLLLILLFLHAFGPGAFLLLGHQ